MISNVIKSGANQLPRQRLRVLPEQRLRREHVGQQPLGRAEAGAHAEHLRRHPRRSHRQEQAVLLRRLPGHDPGRAGHRRRSRSRPTAWRRGDLSSVSAVDPRPRDRAGLPRQPDPAQPDQPGRARDPERPELPAAQPHGHRRHRQLRRRLAEHDPRPPGRRPARLERVDQRQGLRAVLVRGATRSRTTSRPFPFILGGRRTARSATWPSTGTASSGSSLINEVLVGYNSIDNHHGHSTTGAGSVTRTRRSGSPAASRSPASARSSGAAGSRAIGDRGRPRNTLAEDLPDQREAHLAQGPARA